MQTHRSSIKYQISARTPLLTTRAPRPTQYRPNPAVSLLLAHFLRLEQQAAAAPVLAGRRPALEARVLAKAGRGGDQRATPMQRMQACRDSLRRLDELGWNRSYHQRLFHDDFLVRAVSCFLCP